MSNYTKSTNFATKDALPSGDPLKIVKGTEIDTEFNNIATAIATKADLASPTFTGTPAAPTASAGDNSTQIATTAFVTAALQAAYPVGSIYINAGVTTNPATLLGFGTWTAFGAGRVMVGLNGSDSLFDALEETGGSKDATVVSHTHTYSGTTSTIGDHQHVSPDGQQFITTTPGGIYGGGGSSLYPSGSNLTQGAGSHNHTFSGTTASSGSSGTNANIQPYITVAMWKRTA
jgi:hypothetical protein